MPCSRPIILRASIGQSVEVDREAGEIRGVSVITAGTTKPSAGGDPFDVDAVTLQQITDAINASDIGVKSRMTHPEVEGLDDLPCRLGYIRNARIQGDKVVADMVFHNAASNEAITLMSIAEADPSSCGLSIVDFDAALEQANGTPTGIVLRVDTIDAVDWVGAPAANPAGMLSALRRTFRANLMKGHNVFNQQQLDYLIGIGLDAEANAEAIVSFVEGLDEEQKAALDALATVEDPAAPAPEEGAAMNEEEEEQPVAASEGEEDKEKIAASARRNKGGVSLSQADIDKRIAASRKAERNRVKEINAIALRCGYEKAWIDKHVDAETPIDEVRRVALASLKRNPEDMATNQVKVGADRNRDTLNQAVQDAIMLKAGRTRFVKHDDAGGVMLSADSKPEMRKPHDRASEFRGHSIIEMGRRYLVSLGYRDADRLSKTQLATLLMSRSHLQAAMPGVYLAHATGDFPFLLADTMGKVLRDEYTLTPHTWEKWCRKTTAPDFKDIKSIQLSEAANLEVIPEGDEYTFAKLTEGQEKYALRTHGKGLVFTRQMLINDDLSAFDRVPRKLGNAAMRAVESEAISILTDNAALADGVALFATAHGNLSTGDLTPSNAVASLDAAIVKLQTQTALGSDDPLDLQPRYLLVPSAIQFKARVATASGVDPSLSNATPNPIAGENIEVIPSARLNSDSTTQWYLLADQSQIDTVEMAFLEGEETPVIEEEDEFDTDARRIKIRHTFRGKAIDYRGMVRSSGA